MAKDIEIAFSSIRHHPEFRRLTPGARGAFMTLAQVCLLDGYDPLPEATTALCRLAGSVPCQWKGIRNDVVRALGALLGMLKTDYAKQQQKAANWHRTALIAGAASALSRKRKDELTTRAHNFVSEPVQDLGFIQPFQHQTFKPQTYDAKSRAHAVKVLANNKAAPLKD